MPIEAHGETTAEPRLHLMQPAALDVEGVLAREQPQVIIHGLGDHRALLAGRARRGTLVVDDRRRHEHDRGRGQRRHEGRSPPAPPRTPGRRLRPPGGEPALERERGGMLRQALLEQPSQLLLHRVGSRATRAAFEVCAYRLLRLEPRAALLVVEQVLPHLIARHSSLTARSPSACGGAPPARGRASI